MQLTKEQAKSLCRPSMADWGSLGNPTEAELEAKIAEFQTKPDPEKKRILRHLSSSRIEDLEERVDSLENERNSGNASNRDQIEIAHYELSGNQTLPINTTTTVAFAQALNGSSSLAQLGLTLNNGVFTASRAKVLMVAYQLRFSADANSNGYRQGSISIGTEFFARNQSVTLAVATHVSGSYPISLGRGDSFSIKAFASGLTNLVAEGTRLTIASF